MKPLIKFLPDTRHQLIGVFADIDDMLTIDGQMQADSYGVMENIRENGIVVVPITCRPPGWCDLIARICD